MAASNVTLKVTADTTEFRREMKRTARWLRWRLLIPSLLAGFVGGLAAATVLLAVAR